MDFRNPIPISIVQAPAVAATGLMTLERIYVIGGRTPFYITNATQIYNTKDDSWTFGASFPTLHDWITEYLTATVLNDTIYVVGGIANANEGFYELTEQYVPTGYNGTINLPSSSSSPSPSLTRAPTVAPSNSSTASPSLNTSTATSSAQPSDYTPSPTPSVPEMPTLTSIIALGIATCVIAVIIRKKPNRFFA